jgi:tRNA(Ile)-lysidine synthase
MPVETPFGAGWHQRPLLGFPRASLQAWAHSQRLPEWVRDPANEQPRFARNHLRHEVLPAIRAHWPGAAAAASRSARHCAEAASLLEELAELDAAACVEGEALSVPGMRQLSAARCRNLVRWQCRQLGLPVPDERRLASLLAQVLEAAPDTHPEIRWPGVVATRHADGLWLMPEAGLAEVPAPLAWPDPSTPLALGPGLGTLAIEPTRGGGLRRDALTSAPWRVVFRTGGERLQLPGRAGRHSLKNLLQAAGVPPWIRSRIPLLEVGGRLAAVGDLWIDESWWTPPETEGWRLRWEGCTLPGRGPFIVGGQPF